METAPGRLLHAWERGCLDEVVADIFGFHALQLGLPSIDALSANRMPHRWTALRADEATAGREPDLRTDFGALPFPEASLDLLVLPHALEMSADPHATLREVSRVLVPEGRVVIAGFNPASLWGLRQRRAHLWRRLGWGALYLPAEGEFIGYWRLRDWLRLLGFEVETVRFGCWRPALRHEAWLARFAWMDRLGARWWPIFGAVYFIVAIKRVPGARLLSPGWKRAPVATAAPAGVAGQARPATPGGHEQERHR